MDIFRRQLMTIGDCWCDDTSAVFEKTMVNSHYSSQFVTLLIITHHSVLFT